eukprot:c6687_g1_i1.p1 GENE.c6687_g1_i1~~c6687_g1_i1.p1  ORF type:complete len:530 (-),score=98.51 c6687_g1_i1:18-1607(-)
MFRRLVVFQIVLLCFAVVALIVCLSPSIDQSYQSTIQTIDDLIQELRLSNTPDSVDMAEKLQKSEKISKSIPKENAQPKSEDSAHIRPQCMRYADGSEVCKYAELCYDAAGDGALILHNFPELISPNFRIDWRFYEPIRSAQPPIEHRAFPFDLTHTLKSYNDNQWTEIQSHSETKHFDGAHIVLLQPPFRSGGNNLFHFSASVMMLTDPLFHNHTVGGWYPALDDVVLIGGEGSLNPWTQGLMDVLVPKSSKLHIVEPGQKFCFKNTVIHGYRRSLFVGKEDGYRFTVHTYKQLGITMSPAYQTEELKFPVRVLLLNRKNRAIHNVDEIKTMIESDAIVRYNEKLLPIYERYKAEHDTIPPLCTVTVEDSIENLSFKEQVELWATHDLIIGPHGAGLTAIMFARPHLSLIEVYPHKFLPTLYRDIAIASGHGHYGVMGEPLPIKEFERDPRDGDYCELWHGVDILNEGHCHHQYFKYATIDVDIKWMEKVVQLAIESIPFQTTPTRRWFYDPIVPEWLKPYVPFHEKQ